MSAHHSLSSRWQICVDYLMPVAHACADFCFSSVSASFCTSTPMRSCIAATKRASSVLPPSHLVCRDDVRELHRVICRPIVCNACSTRLYHSYSLPVCAINDAYMYIGRSNSVTYAERLNILRADSMELRCGELRYTSNVKYLTLYHFCLYHHTRT